MPSPHAPQVLLDQRFTDMDECGRRLGWSFDFRQLDRGRLDVGATLLATAAGSTVMRLELNRAFHQAGSPPDGMLTFGIPDPDAGDVGWCGATATDSYLLNFNLPDGFDGTSRAGFSGYTMSFTKDRLREVQQIMGIDLDSRIRVSEHPVWTSSPEATARLRRGIAAAVRAANAGRGFVDPEVNELFDFRVPALILNTITGNEGDYGVPDLPLRRRAVHTALDFLDAHDHLPLTVSELCRRAGVSVPSLYRGFMERFGIGPKQYLHVRRLDGVRRELRSAPSEVRVVDVANRWGFWHMGRFAADYRKQFGELPSQALHNVKAS